MDIQWPLVFFTVLGGAGGWLVALVALNEFTGKSKSEKGRFVSLIVSIILVVLGGIASTMHLTHVDRIMGALSHPTSGIFTEALLSGLIIVAIIILLVLIRRDASKSAIKAMAVIAGVLGLILPFATGMSYMMAAKPAWNTILFPLACFGTTGVTGAATYLVIQFSAKDDKTATDDTARLLSIFGVVAAVLAIAYVAYVYSTGTVTGSEQALYWGGVIVVGCLLPALCARFARKGNSAPTLAIVALIGAFVGSFAFRCFMWLVGAGIMTLIGNGNWFGSI